MKISPSAGKPADPTILIDIPKLVAAYLEDRPHPSAAVERILFGTSGHHSCLFDMLNVILSEAQSMMQRALDSSEPGDNSRRVCVQ